MTIAFTGGGTGGHFYPIIAITEALQDMVREEHLIQPKLYYLAPSPFDEKALFDNGITYVNIPAGKVRRYFSIQNISDFFVTLAGTMRALNTLYNLYLSYKPSIEKINMTVFFGVENLTNVKYSSFGSDNFSWGGINTYYPMPEISFKGVISFAF